MRRPFITMLAFFVPFVLSAEPKVIDLNGIWQLRDLDPGQGIDRRVHEIEISAESTIPVRIPGTVRQALLDAGKIPDPYIGTQNEASLWTEGKEWWFTRSFEVPKDWADRRVTLDFDGIVFKGEAWLNGKIIGSMEGMFNPRSFDVESVLHFDMPNFLAVRLEAPEDARRIEKTRGLTFDMNRDQLYSIAQCLFSWDWGPHAVPVGIWRPVRLKASDDVRIRNPYTVSSILSDTKAVVALSLEAKNLYDRMIDATIHGSITGKNFEIDPIPFSRTVSLKPGEIRTIQWELTVDQPRLWWPNGMGDQNLYQVNAEVLVGKAVSDRLTQSFGIRELKLVQNESVDEFLKTMKEHTGSQYHLGKVVGTYPWTFQINGKKMFAKGGNWIPIDQMLNLPRERYERLLRLARDAHFNLMRVWGGGLYETEDFYELCDELGILAWQEFLSNKNFSKIDKANFLEGAQASMLRIRNHPSLVFWCGGNEFDPDDQGSKAVIDDLDSLVRKIDPGREFHRASPYMGDDHYWGVWHGYEPYTNYRIVRPFRSEAGMNTFPVMENYRRFMPSDNLWPPDETLIEYHGENNTRFHHLKKLQRYADEFGPSSSIKEFVMKSQFSQAIAESFNMEFCRRNQFKNSGLLIWQYNDIWPVISWSLVDWYGTPKPGYYFVKRSSRPVHVSADYEKYLWHSGETFHADVWMLNDTDRPAAGNYSVRLMDVTGAMLAEKTGHVEGDANRSVKADVVDWPIPKTYRGRTLFLSVQLSDGKKIISDAIYPIAVSKKSGGEDYEGIFSEMNRMPEVGLKTECSIIKKSTPGSVEYRLTLTNPSTAVAFFVHARLASDNGSVTVYFDDNDVSILPGQSKTLTVVLTGMKETMPQDAVFEISGWNCPKQTLPVTGIY